MPGCLRNYQVSHSSATAMSSGQGNLYDLAQGRETAKYRCRAGLYFRCVKKSSLLWAASTEPLQINTGHWHDMQISVAALGLSRAELVSNSGHCLQVIPSVPEGKEKANFCTTMFPYSCKPLKSSTYSEKLCSKRFMLIVPRKATGQGTYSSCAQEPWM